MKRKRRVFPSLEGKMREHFSQQVLSWTWRLVHKGTSANRKMKIVFELEQVTARSLEDYEIS